MREQPLSLNSFTNLMFYRDLNQAMDYYFTNHAADEMAKQAQSNASKFDTKRCQELFAKYAGKNEVMDQDAIEAFFKDLGVDATTDIIAILVAQYCEAQSMGEFKQAEFIKGCTVLGADNIKAWQDALNKKLRPELK